MCVNTLRISNVPRPLWLLLICQNARAGGLIGLQLFSPKRQAVPGFTSALFWCRPANHCVGYLIRVTGTVKSGKESAGYMSILLQVPIHWWLGSRAGSWEVWLRWFWLIWLHLPCRSDGTMLHSKPVTSRKRKQCGVWLIPHITWQYSKLEQKCLFL